MYMRVAITVHLSDAAINDDEKLRRIKHTYELQSHKKCTFASPTLFNSCTKNRQMLSCFLFGTADTAEEITRTQTNTALTSKQNGGIGIYMHDIRANGSMIRSSNRPSSGLVKQIKIYNEIGQNWNQGGKREGAIAIYLELWHADIMDFLLLKHNNGDESQRARKLFYAVWMSELFQKRVDENAEWSLFDSTVAPGLSSVYDGMRVCTRCDYMQNRDYFAFKIGYKHQDKYRVHNGEAILMRECDDGREIEEKFHKYVKRNVTCCSEITFDDNISEPRGEKLHVYQSRNVFTDLYTHYEHCGLAIRKLPAREVQLAIQASQAESGTPYVLNKDSINRRSPQSNIGTIKSSNLCAEITLWTSPYSYANCTLASLKLDTYWHKINPQSDKHEFDFVALRETTRDIIIALDRIVDTTIYPVAECLHNKTNFRPIAVGIQGLADLFMKMRIPFICDESNELTIRIMENIYYAAIETSCELAQTLGAYSEFAGSPASRGKLQFDLWQDDVDYRGIDPWGNWKKFPLTTLDWEPLRQKVMKYGLRNSCLVALMPTVSTAQILDSSESFEPPTHHLFVKTTLSGKYVQYNDRMIRHLMEINKFDSAVITQLYTTGTIEQIQSIPREVRNIYKTVYDIPQMDIMRRAALMSAFVDQSMSLNIHLSERTDSKLAGVTKFGMSEVPLKTISYYIRGLPPIQTMGVANLAVLHEAPVVVSVKQTEATVCDSCTG
jgi:ribonucleotide reductase alpha subunit